MINKDSHLTTTLEAVGCHFPKQNTRGRICLYDVPSFLYSNIMKVVIFELSSLFPQLPSVEVGGNHLSFFSMQIFTYVPMQGPWLELCGLMIIWPQKPSEREAFKCMLSLPTTLGSRQHMLTQCFTKKGSFPEVSQKVGYQSSRSTACSLLKCKLEKL